MGSIGIHGNQHAYYTQQTQNTQKTDGVHGDKDVTGSAAALKFTETYKRIQFAISHPEIDGAANLTPDEMEELVASAADKAQNAKCHFRGKSIMFDIYALMELIQEIGQKMRDAMRELRKLENQAIYANIRSQAATQRYAAKCALIAGSVMCFLQSAATVAMFSFQLKNLGDQKKLQQQQGLDVLDEQAKMTQVDNQEAAVKQLDKVAKATPQSVREKAELNKATEAKSAIEGAKKEIKDGVAKRTECEEALKGAKDGLSAAQKRLDAFQPGESGEKLAAAQKNLDTAQKNLDTARSKVDQAKLEYDKAQAEWGRLAKQEKGNPVKSSEFHAAKDAVVRASVKLDDAKAEFTKAEGEWTKAQEAVTTAKSAADAAAGNFKASFAEPRDNLLKAEQKATEAKGKLEQAQKEFEAANAAEPKDEAKCAELKQKFDAAKSEFGEAANGLEAAKEADARSLHGQLDRATETSSRLAEIDQELESLKANPNAEKEQQLLSEQNKLKTELGEIKKGLQGAGVSEQQLKDYAQAKQDVATAQKDVAKAEEQVAKSNEILGKAYEKYKASTGVEIKGPDDLQKPEVVKAESQKIHEAALQDVETAHSNWEKLRMKANNEERVDGKVSPETQKALTEAEQTYKYVRAKQVAQSFSLPGIQGSDLDKATIQANERYVAATRNPLMEGNALKFKKTEFKLSMMQSLNQIFGNFGQQAISSMKESLSAAATEKAADQKLSEDQLDQIKDLMQQAMSLIQKAIDIFQSIVSKESQTIDQLANSFA